jgi:hypothetical protein
MQHSADLARGNVASHVTTPSWSSACGRSIQDRFLLMADTRVDMKSRILFTITTLYLLCLVLPSSVAASKSDESTVIASVDFFGYGKFDVVKLRSSLPVQAGNSLNRSEWTAYRSRIEAAVRARTGKRTTDVALLCCNEQGNSMIYIGVAGATNIAVQHKPVCFPSPGNVARHYQRDRRRLPNRGSRLKSARNNSTKGAVYVTLISVLTDGLTQSST